MGASGSYPYKWALLKFKMLLYSLRSSLMTSFLFTLFLVSNSQRPGVPIKCLFLIEVAICIHCHVGITYKKFVTFFPLTIIDIENATSVYKRWQVGTCNRTETLANVRTSSLLTTPTSSSEVAANLVLVGVLYGGSAEVATGGPSILVLRGVSYDGGGVV
jgi:hypothetical protein